LGWVKVAVHPNRVYNVLGEDRVGVLSEVETPGMVEIECTVTGVKLLVMPTDIEAV
jgi:predicted amino acid-binding ACT domain protein